MVLAKGNAKQIESSSNEKPVFLMFVDRYCLRILVLLEILLIIIKLVKPGPSLAFMLKKRFLNATSRVPMFLFFCLAFSKL